MNKKVFEGTVFVEKYPSWFRIIIGKRPETKEGYRLVSGKLLFNMIFKEAFKRKEPIWVKGLLKGKELLVLRIS